MKHATHCTWSNKCSASRAPTKKTAEFASRQGWLFSGFERICIEAAAEIGQHIKAIAAKAIKALKFGSYRLIKMKKAHQLVLELDAIAQIPLFIKAPIRT